MFGGPWTYDAEPHGKATGEDSIWLAEAMATVGAVVGGRWTYEAAEHWGDKNPWDLPFFIVTHRWISSTSGYDSRRSRRSSTTG